MIHFRTFRNADPPGLAEVWNEAFTGRGAVQLRHSSPLERFAFSKPYFDPKGVIVAEEDGKHVGFAHAAFGANSAETALSHSVGVTCAIGVRPAFQRRGIGTELLRRSEAYLRERGAELLYAGGMRPLNPMYFGLYGGADLPGFLESDAAAAPFLKAHGYHPEVSSLVFQRALDKPVSVIDARFVSIRNKFEIQAVPRGGVDTWWQECTLGPVELIEFRLVETATNETVASAAAWEMEGFSWRWGLPAVGVLSLMVEESRRRQGLGKFLVTCILRYLQDQYFGIVEAHAIGDNPAVISLLGTLGFEPIDRGHVYRRSDSTV